MSSMSREYSTRITTPPQVTITANGVPLPAGELRFLGEIRVQGRLNMPTLCELTFIDPPAAAHTAALFAPATSLRIHTGTQPVPLFAGEVTALEHVYAAASGYQIRVRGYDLLHRLRQRQSVRAHVQVTPIDLARELVANLGVTVEYHGSLLGQLVPGSGLPSWPRLIQHRQSDLELLVEVMERCGLYFTLREHVLHLHTLDGIGAPLPLTLGTSLLEARLEVNSDPVCSAVSASGWDPLRAEVHAGRAGQARVAPGIRGDDPRAVAQIDFAAGELFAVNEGTPDDRHAGSLAQAELDRRAAAQLTLWGVAEGDALLQPGTPIAILGGTGPLAGQYVPASVTHTIDSRSGYLSELSTVPPPAHPRPTGVVMALGQVTRVDDPQRLGRIKVSLLSYQNVETDWMCVMAPGAGSGKGLITIPEVGDQVLLLLAHEDPGQGVVLGGLYGMGGAPDSGVEGGAVRRYTLLTPGGQRIRLDDVQHAIRLEDSQGSYVELSPQKVRVHAAVDLELEAPGKAVVIRGQSIDFERG